MVCDVYRARRTAINDAQRRNDLLLYLPQSYLYFVKEKKKKNEQRDALSDTFRFLIFFHTIKKTIEIRYESANRRVISW